MARNALTYQLVTPGGVLHMTPQQARRLISAASQQLESNKRDNRGITQPEVDLLQGIADFRKSCPGLL